MKIKKTVLAALCSAIVLSGCGGDQQTDTKAEAAFDKPQYEWGDISGEKLVIWGIYPEMERPLTATGSSPAMNWRLYRFPRRSLNNRYCQAWPGKLKSPISC